MLNTLVQAFDGPGAGFMYAIAAVMALGIAVVVERVWLLWFSWRLDFPRVVGSIEARNASQAEDDAGLAPVAAVIQSGMAAATSAAAWDSMGAKAAMVESQVRQRIGVLAMVSNVATMLGLLGTVYGLILAFSALGDVSALERNARLSEGIATAMATTAWGLLVGIPALAAHHFVMAKADRTLAQYQSIAGHVAASTHR